MPSKYATIDTNLLLRIILNDQPDMRRRALQLLTDDDCTFILPDIVFFELVYILEGYDYPRPFISQFLFETLASLYTISYDRTILTDVLPFYVSHPKLSFADCYLTHYAVQHDSEPLYTFDKKLTAQAPSARPVPTSSSSQTP